jgi:carbonic anhydrase/acetyltransferase-like protein (isoleucine patch superfamily)
VSDLDAAIVQKLQEHAQRGIDHSFFNRADTYAETDLLDLFCFHRESRQTVTPTYDKDGSLALWVVNCGKAQDLPVETLLVHAERASRYFIRGYVRRLSHLRDLRQIAADMLQGLSETGPSGRQLRPGVWTDQGAEVHRRARIVAPAYIGCGSKVRADALITRHSNIERDCGVDSGTVVEDSTILANTSVGICLDLCHAVVSGNKLFNLERDVMIEVADPDVIRSTAATQKPIANLIERGERPEKVSDSRKLPQIPEWQFDGNLIQE